MEPTSEQELKQLLDEGRISQEEYQQLKEAMQQQLQSPTMSDGELKLRKKLLLFSLTMCIIGLPAGLVLGLPFVWGLSIFGIIANVINMKRYGII
ncbi:MAG: SHOCT domain-containing protein [Planctomycetota bacterium]|jgi:hypothetical protein